MGNSIRQIQKLNTRKRIIETAYKIFSEKGFSVPSTMIAKEAGVAHGSIFSHFPTMNELIVCLLSDFGEQIGVRLHELAKKCDSVENLLKEHLMALEEYEAFYTRLILEKDRLPDEAKNTYAMIQSILAFHFSSVIEREIKKGTVKNLPIHMLFNTWLGLVHYYLMNKDFFADSNESVIKRYGTELLSIYLNLIKNESKV
ncbi:TetR/AcrR family transcriptional regulator [Defluviitalea raffinosedens]|uniref:TetR family transcriptional regulator n=1 Tax=Defluviitalea raffinosedens TaxID=1450156 RepID=A0A7C8LGD4_9FIRM|nr:TetR/AcrR family transcriptional regulator [Defluviitalea raffinosedens]KAE9629431.1 TetR family transcriptional regulator [Defluviitalea raffinosedens]MBM7686670.1 AcrR family transcriptional regulator [Defluviitalea raffinosedens]MBZ4667111.1 transcriptional regulator [Defluviitaleaceae bacterium]HHW66427.1 TetR/AcrR family transcriptional regulator [Candidatus Epulonipiscium sp.]